MIQRHEAHLIAEAEAKKRGLGTGIRYLYLWKDLPFREPRLCPVDLTNCWIAYVEPPMRGLMASTIITVDKDFGVVTYFGTANDEG